MLSTLKSKLAVAMFVGLLTISFSLGILLTMTVGERNAIKTSLDNANSVIKERDRTVKEKTEESNSNLQSFNGCQTQLKLLNKQAEEQAFASQQSDREASSRANTALAALPGLIKQDRELSAEPRVATRWVQDLFK